MYFGYTSVLWLIRTSVMKNYFTGIYQFVVSRLYFVCLNPGLLLPSYMHASVILSLSSPHCLLSTDHLSLSLFLQMLSLQITPPTSFYPPRPTYYCHILSLNWKHFGNTYCEPLLFWRCTPVIAICLFCGLPNIGRCMF